MLTPTFPTLTIPTLTVTFPTQTFPTLTFPTLTVTFPTQTFPTLPTPTLTFPTLTFPTLPTPTLTFPTLTVPTIVQTVRPGDLITAQYMNQLVGLVQQLFQRIATAELQQQQLLARLQHLEQRVAALEQASPTPTFPTATPTFPTATFPTATLTFPTATFPTATLTFPTATFPTATFPTATLTFPTATFPTATLTFPTATFPTATLTFPTATFPTATLTFPTATFPTATLTFPTATFPTATFPTATFPTGGQPTLSFPTGGMPTGGMPTMSVPISIPGFGSTFGVIGLMTQPTFAPGMPGRVPGAATGRTPMEVAGIGAREREALSAAGVDDLGVLAEADPAGIAAVLKVDTGTARRFVNEARALIGLPPAAGEAAPGEAPSLRAVSGIGRVRAGRLAEAGIPDARALAAAPAERIAAALDVSEDQARTFIEHARTLLGS